MDRVTDSELGGKPMRDIKREADEYVWGKFPAWAIWALIIVIVIGVINLVLLIGAIQ